MIEQTYKLDLVPQGMVTVVHVSQYDSGSRTLTFELQKDGAAYTPPANLTAYLSGKKPDNTIFYYEMTVSGNKASVVIQEQMTVIPGDVDCKIILSASGEQIGTTKFLLVVEATPTSGGIVSESDIPIFERILNDTLAASAEAKAQADRAEQAASAVDTIPVPTVVQIWTETDPTE